jgi:hypothetical protein
MKGKHVGGSYCGFYASGSFWLWVLHNFSTALQQREQHDLLRRGRNAAKLTSPFGILDCQFRALEANAAMGSVAEGLVYRTTAATERKSSLASEVKLVAVRIDQIERAFGSLDSIGTVGPYCDFNVSHEF